MLHAVFSALSNFTTAYICISSNQSMAFANICLMCNALCETWPTYAQKF